MAERLENSMLAVKLENTVDDYIGIVNRRWCREGVLRSYERR